MPRKPACRPFSDAFIGTFIDRWQDLLRRHTGDETVRLTYVIHHDPRCDRLAVTCSIGTGREDWPTKCSICGRSLNLGDTFWYDITGDLPSLESVCDKCRGNISLLASEAIPREFAKRTRRFVCKAGFVRVQEDLPPLTLKLERFMLDVRAWAARARERPPQPVPGPKRPRGRPRIEGGTPEEIKRREKMRERMRIRNERKKAQRHETPIS